MRPAQARVAPGQPGRRVRDAADGKEESEGRLAPGQPPCRVLVQMEHFAHGSQPELVDLRACEVHEGRVGVERAEGGDLRLLGQVLRHVTERAADFEHAQLADTARPEVGEQRAQEMAPPRLLEVEVQRRTPDTLAVHQHADDARAVARRVLAAAGLEHAAVAEGYDAKRLHRRLSCHARRAITSSMWPSRRSAGSVYRARRANRVIHARGAGVGGGGGGPPGGPPGGGRPPGGPAPAPTPAVTVGARRCPALARGLGARTVLLARRSTPRSTRAGSYGTAVSGSNLWRWRAVKNSSRVKAY